MYAPHGSPKRSHKTQHFAPFLKVFIILLRVIGMPADTTAPMLQPLSRWRRRLIVGGLVCLVLFQLPSTTIFVESGQAPRDFEQREHYWRPATGHLHQLKKHDCASQRGHSYRMIAKIYCGAHIPARVHSSRGKSAQKRARARACV